MPKKPNMPGNICNSCTTTMIDFNNMLMKFQESDSYLRELEENSVFCTGDVGIIKTAECSKKNKNVEHVIAYNDSNIIKNGTFVVQSVKEKEIEEFEEKIHIEIVDEQVPSISENLNCRMSEDVPNQLLYETEDELFLKSVKFVCNKCDDSFLKKSGFAQHMIQKHNKFIQPDEYTQYVFDINLKVPKGMPTLKQPVLRHNSSTNECRICKETFETVNDLKLHLNVHKTYICEKCGATFIRKSDLNDHFTVHSTERRFECKFCNKRFKGRNTLRMHKLTHFNTRNHTCDVCGQRFKDKGTLKTHIKLKHTSERNFKCSKCSLSFKLKPWLQKHYIRRHTERSKDFECDLCGIAYFNKSSLLRHVAEKHSGVITTHACNVCNKLFSSKGAVNKHLKNVHKIDLE